MSARIAIAMAGLVALVALAIGGMAYLPVSQSIYDARLLGMESNARLIIQDFADVVQTAAGDVQLIADTPDILALADAHASQDPEAWDALRADATALLRALLRARPAYVQARLIGAFGDGREIIRIERTAEGQPIAVTSPEALQAKGDRDYYVEALRARAGEVYVSALDLNRERGVIETPHMPVQRVAAQVAYADGSIFGLIVLNIDMRPALAKLQASVDTALEVRLFDASGRYLAHPSPGRAFAFEFGGVTGASDEFPDIRLDDGRFILAGAPIGGAAASHTVARSQDAAGRDLALAGAVRRLGEGRAVMLLLSARREDLFASIAAAASRYAIVGLVIALAAIGLCLSLARSIARPLAELAQAIRRHAKGEAARFPTGGPAEVQTLVSALRRNFEQENLYAAIAQSPANAIVTVSPDGDVTLWNAGAEAMLGYAAEEALGRPFDIIRQSNDDAAPTGGGARGLAATMRRKDGREIEARGAVADLRSPEGEPMGRAWVFRDQTEQIRAEALFRLVVDASPAAMMMVDAAGRIVLANRRALEMFEYTETDLVGRPVERLLPPNAARTHPDLRNAFLADPSRREMGAGRDLAARRGGGQEFPVEVGLNPIETADGPMTLAVVVDISERRRADAWFKISVESAPAAMLLVDESGKIILANNESHAIFGYEADALTGASIETLVPESIRKAHPQLRGAFTHWKPERRRMGSGRELHGLRKDGSLVPIEVGLNPIASNDERLTLAVVVDITDRKATEAALKRHAEELEQSNEELRQFAYITSHDLQEPLRMVASFCSLLKEQYGPQLDAEANEFIDFAVDGAMRMRQMISDLLDYSRLQSSEFAFAPTPSLQALKEALQNSAGAIAEADAEIVYGDLPIVESNARLLTQLFQNLVGNAVKFRSGARPRVEIVAKELEDAWRFQVIDNGIGIDPAQAEDVFGVFRRLHTREEYPGTGIGLAHCRRIVERHGGKIWVEKYSGNGSTLAFTLPKRDVR